MMPAWVVIATRVGAGSAWRWVEGWDQGTLDYARDAGEIVQAIRRLSERWEIVVQPRQAPLGSKPLPPLPRGRVTNTGNRRRHWRNAMLADFS